MLRANSSLSVLLFHLQGATAWHLDFQLLLTFRLRCPLLVRRFLYSDMFHNLHF